MPDFRRYFVAGGTYFFTLVTAERRPIFHEESARVILGNAIRDQQKERPFKLVAIVLLPEHMHAIWSLPSGDHRYDDRWKAIKARFTSEWLASGGTEVDIAPGYKKQRRRGVWQPRFMEHTIRDENDLHHRADYIHWNPVKHGHVKCACDWPWSSFHRLVKTGDYDRNWGCGQQSPSDFSRVNMGLVE